MKPKIKEILLENKADARGWLFQIPGSLLEGEMKHVLVSSLKPGVVRGNHYHTRKAEWFIVIKGNLEVEYFHLDKPSEKTNLHLSDKEFRLIRFEPFFVHKLTNIGKEEAILMGIVNEEFDEKDIDTFWWKG